MIPTPKSVLNVVSRHGWRFPSRAIDWLLQKALESRFDRRYKVNTGFSIAVDKLDYVDKATQGQAEKYGPSPVYPVLKALRVFRKVSSLEFGQSTFVDFGCGAGRVMIIAAELGFKKVIGVELSPHLVQVCLSNIGTYSLSHRASDIRVVNENAADFVVPDDSNVFYFFAPFGPEIYKTVLQNIRLSVSLNPRRVYVLDLLRKHEAVEDEFSRQGYRTICTVDFLSKHTSVARDGSLTEQGGRLRILRLSL